jgi:hypothetical protein
MQTMVSTAGAALGNALAVQQAESDELQAGAKAGPWVVERELGRGGMGSVYAVTHEDIGKKAALKVMHRRLVTTQSAERILLEARVVNQVGHPNIVDIFETGTFPDGRPYIVMERLEGVPLSFRADEGKILPDQVIGSGHLDPAASLRRADRRARRERRAPRPQARQRVPDRQPG